MFQGNCPVPLEPVKGTPTSRFAAPLRFPDSLQKKLEVRVGTPPRFTRKLRGRFMRGPWALRLQKATGNAVLPRQRPGGGCQTSIRPAKQQSSSLLGPVDPSFRALSGRLKFTVRRHKFNKDSLSSKVKRVAGDASTASYPLQQSGVVGSVRSPRVVPPSYVAPTGLPPGTSMSKSMVASTNGITFSSCLLLSSLELSDTKAYEP